MQPLVLEGRARGFPDHSDWLGQEKFGAGAGAGAEGCEGSQQQAGLRKDERWKCSPGRGRKDRGGGGREGARGKEGKK